MGFSYVHYSNARRCDGALYDGRRIDIYRIDVGAMVGWGRSTRISPGAHGACWEKLQGQYARNLGDDMKHITRCVLKMVETDSGEETLRTVDATVRSRGDMTIVSIPDVQPGIDLKIYVERLTTIRAHGRELCVPSMN